MTEQELFEALSTTSLGKDLKRHLETIVIELSDLRTIKGDPAVAVQARKDAIEIIEKRMINKLRVFSQDKKTTKSEWS